MHQMIPGSIQRMTAGPVSRNLICLQYPRKDMHVKWQVGDESQSQSANACVSWAHSVEHGGLQCDDAVRTTHW